MRTMSPCEECKKRWLDIDTATRCHDHCVEFQDWRSKEDKLNKKVNDHRREYNDYVEFKNHTINKNLKS